MPTDCGASLGHPAGGEALAGMDSLRAESVERPLVMKITRGVVDLVADLAARRSGTKVCVRTWADVTFTSHVSLII